MPIPSDIEVLRLKVIAYNNRRLQDELHHENSVYEQLNRKALADAQLYARTGRVKSPSPTLSSDKEGSASDFVVQKTQERKEVARSKASCDVAVLKENVQVKLKELHVLVSSDSEEDFCRCEEGGKQFSISKSSDAVQPVVTSQEETTEDSDSDFHASDCEINSTSNSSSSSKPKWFTEDVTLPGKEVSSNLENGSLLLRSTTEKNDTHRDSLYPTSNTLASGQETMVTSVRNEDRPQSWYDKGNKSRTRKSRVSKRAANAKDKDVEHEVSEVPLNSTGLQKISVKDSKRLRGKKNGKTVSPAVVDVLLGRGQNSVADVNELRRKREEDTLKCGRRVRTVGSARSRSHSPVSPVNSSQEENVQKEVAAKMRSDNRERGPSFSSVPLSPRDRNLGQNFADVQDGVQNAMQDSEAVQSVSENPTSINVDVIVPNRKELQSKISQVRLDERVDNEKEKEVFKDPQEYDRTPSPVVHYRQKVTGSQVQQYSHSRHRSPIENPSRRSRIIRSPSPRRSLSPSPLQQKRINDFNVRAEQRDEEVRGRRTERTPEDDQHIRRPSFEEAYRQKSQDESRYARSERCLLPHSPSQRRIERTRSPSYEARRSPFHADLAAENGKLEVGRIERSGKTSQLALSSSSADRRTRRYKVAVIESHKLERKKEGKKPFYLTLTNDGEPYGPGRPAWVAEVNKLAAGLDPSCTHIRKQTHEDMCILKDRLDDHFEYSGELNQDYLRSLLGKAVTRRRIDLISYINKGGQRPLNFDKTIWDKLEKLASSKQRETRSEQGRYANACQRTMGRTGSLGMEGVRRKLAKLYGRSPDPEEVAHEMERDKGFGKTKRESLGMTQAITEYFIDNDNEDHCPELLQHENSFDGSLSQEVRNRKRKSPPPLPFNQGKSKVRVPGGTMNEVTEGVHESRSKSKDNYIAHLEAELRKFKGYSGRDYSDRTPLMYDYRGRRCEDNEGVMDGFSAGTSRDAEGSRMGVSRK